jgi:hypothetical protein
MRLIRGIHDTHLLYPLPGPRTQVHPTPIGRDLGGGSVALNQEVVAELARCGQE